MPSSTIGRYNSPTCTLEIRKKTAPLLAWSSRNKIENIYFELHLNDPKSSQTETITIYGDRDKLQQLCVAVEDYVQQFLALTPTSLSLKAEKATKNYNNYAPSLQPKDLLVHQLCLGALATEKSGQQIELSPLQLFDLATALEKYSADLAAIDSYWRQKTKLTPDRKISLAAAAISLMALGAIALRWLNPPTPATQTISSSTREEAESFDRSFEVLPPPQQQNPPGSKPNLNNPQTNDIEPFQESQLPETQATRPRSILTKPQQEADRSSISRRVKPELPNLPSLEAKDSASRNSVAATDSVKENNDTDIAAEVKDYLQQRWQPPKDLDRSLEYRLIIDRNGSLDRVIPLGYPSQIYRDRTGIPLAGETFVSPLSSLDKLTVRVFLIKDGSVKTFLE